MNNLRTFLSCLYGSEGGTTGVACVQLFLSCLYGSEGHAQVAQGSGCFLSCLYGSEVDTLLDNLSFSKKNMCLRSFNPSFSSVL